MSETRKLSVRLDSKRQALLDQRCAENGCARSELVRQALDQFLRSRNHQAGNCGQTEERILPANTRVVCVEGELARRVEGVVPPGTVPRTDAARERLQERSHVTKPIPAALAEHLPRFRGVGAAIWQERRRLFLNVAAAAAVAQENAENPKDADLFEELLRVGREYGQL